MLDKSELQRVMDVRQILQTKAENLQARQVEIQAELDKVFLDIANYDSMFTIDTENVDVKTPRKREKKVETAPAPPKARTRTSGKPFFKDRMVSVMGKDALNASQVYERLEQAGELPEGSKDPKQYISFTLSKEKGVFERLERGKYRVKDVAQTNDTMETMSNVPEVSSVQMRTLDSDANADDGQDSAHI